MTLRRLVSLSALSVVGSLLLLSGIAFAARSYPDRSGDVTGGAGPDVVSMTISNTAATITFRVRFTKAPPLRVSTQEKWVDMLLLGIDVPPLGPRPVVPGGEWRGANFALGTHGPAKTGQLVRLGVDASPGSRRVGTFKIVTRGATVTFSITRRALGSPRWFTFSLAAARENQESTGGGIDVVPARGTLRYTLT